MTAARQTALRASIIGLALILGSGFWLLWPQHPSSHREAVAQDAYLAVAIRTSALTGPPGSTILAGLGSGALTIPGWLAWLLPPTFSVLLHSREAAVGEGWTLVTDLGWRSRLVGLSSGLLQRRLAPDVALIQDHGTLFVTRNRLLLQDVTLRVSGQKPGAGGRAVPAVFTMPSDTLAVVDLSNTNGEVTPWVERLQAGARFEVFSSIGEVESLHAVIRRKAAGTNVPAGAWHGAVTLRTKHARATERVQADVEYLVDLLDRVMSTGDVGMDKEIRTTPEQIELAVTLHHPERLARIPWAKLGEGALGEGGR